MKEATLRPAPADPFFYLSMFLLFGYVLMSRTFAHWGLRPFYIGEVALGTYFLAKPSSMSLPWLGSLVIPSRFSAFSWWLMISLFYGMLECLRALYTGHTPLAAAEVFVVQLYPLYFFVGAWVGMWHPTMLPGLIRTLAWCHGLYGVAFILILSRLGLTENLDNPHAVGWFGHPGASPIVLLGLLAFERNMRRAAAPLLLNMLVFLGMQRRAEWLSLVVAVTLWAYLAGRMKQLMMVGVLSTCVLLIGLLPDVRFPSPQLRGESLSTRELIGRALAPVFPSTAAELTSNADSHAATASWRSDFWREIWRKVHASEFTTLFGLGYDYPLWHLHPENIDPETPLRTPHNIFFFFLGFGGWAGVLIFAGMQLALGHLLWRTYRETGEPFGICLWVVTLIWALFDPLIDRPFGAIPIYMLMGITAVYRGQPEANSSARGRGFSTNGTTTHETGP